VTVGLVFDDRDAVDSTRAALRGLWERIRAAGRIGDQQLRFVAPVEDAVV